LCHWVSSINSWDWAIATFCWWQFCSLSRLCLHLIHLRLSFRWCLSWLFPWQEKAMKITTAMSLIKHKTVKKWKNWTGRVKLSLKLIHLKLELAIMLDVTMKIPSQLIWQSSQVQTMESALLKPVHWTARKTLKKEFKLMISINIILTLH